GDHLARRRFRAKEHTVQIDSHHRAPSVGRQVHARGRDARAVIVDEHIDTPEVLDRLRDHRLALGGVAYVDGGHLALAAGLDYLIADPSKILGVAAGNEHGSTTFRELLGNRLSDAGSAAGHDGYFAFDAEWIAQS